MGVVPDHRPPRCLTEENDNKRPKHHPDLDINLVCYFFKFSFLKKHLGDEDNVSEKRTHGRCFLSGN